METSMATTNNSEFSAVLDKENKNVIPREYQTKIAKNKVLLINLNSTITEIAKRLILKGFSVYLYDKSKITNEDINTNFYLNKDDFGKDRLTIITNHLLHLSAVVSIIAIKDITQAKDIKFACVGFRNFYELEDYEEYFTRREVIFYCVNISGIYSFYYNNLKHSKKNEVCIDSLSFAKKNNKIINDIKQMKEIKNEEDYLIYSIFLLAMYYRKNVSKEKMKKEIEKDLNRTLNFQKKILYIENYMRLNNIKTLDDNQKLINTLKKFIINFNKEFNPLCVMLGETIANQIYNYLIDKELPKTSLITYNSDNEIFDYGSFLSS